MRNYTIPAILAMTVIVAGIFAFAPIDEATAVHTTIVADLTTEIDNAVVAIAADAAQVTRNGGDTDIDDAETVTFSCTADYLIMGITLDMGPGTYGTDDVSVTIDGDEIATSVPLGSDLGGAVAIIDGAEAATADTLTVLDFNLGTDTDGRGFPHHMTIAIQTEGGCAATPEITPRGLDVTGGTSHNLVSVALTTAGNSSQAFETDHKIIDATVADAGSCTNLEVHLILWYER